ncbi:MAG: ABC transporter permease, partial [Chloroflexota bacterium]
MLLRPARRPSAPRRSQLLFREAMEGRLFALPFVLGFLFWWAYPMGYSIYLVFQDWDLLGEPQFVGLKNVVRLFTDPKVTLSLYNTAFYTFLGVPLHLIIALLLALALNVPLRGIAVYRTIFYLPSVTPAVASAVVWLQIFHPEFGLLNAFLGLFGIPPIKWLFEPTIAKPAFIFMSTWSIGPQIVIFLAGLQAIPRDLYEAALIDGAGAWARFRFVTLPGLSPITFFLVVTGILSSFQAFDLIHVMTRGGPVNATNTLLYHLYEEGFVAFHAGRAGVVAVILFLLLLV